MSPETENFEQLRRLLKLKRYEQPPPRYFNDFPRQIIARIERGERGEGNATAGWMFWDAPWLHRIWAAIEAKPVLAGAFGLVICATLITGAIRSEGTDLQPVAVVPGTESPISSPVALANVMGEAHTLPIPTTGSIEDLSTNPIPAAPLDVPLDLHAQPINFTVPGRN